MKNCGESFDQITDDVFLGGEDYSGSELMKYGIKTVLNVSSDVSFSYKIKEIEGDLLGLAKSGNIVSDYKMPLMEEFPFEDGDSYYFSNVFSTIYDFMLTCKKPLLVHCTAGVSVGPCYFLYLIYLNL